MLFDGASWFALLSWIGQLCSAQSADRLPFGQTDRRPNNLLAECICTCVAFQFALLPGADLHCSAVGQVGEQAASVFLLHSYVFHYRFPVRSAFRTALTSLSQFARR